MNPPTSPSISRPARVQPLVWLSRRSSSFVVLIVCEIAVLLFSRHSAYYTSVALEWTTFALLAQGFNLIAGYGGRMAFGNVMFFGISSYLVVTGAVHHWFPELVGLPIALAVSAVLAYLLSLALWRVSGLLFALATFALATMLGQLVTVFSVFGKSAGLQEPLAVHTSVVHLAFITQFTYLVIGAVLVLLAVVATAWFGRSTVGRELQAARDDRTAASTSGIKARHVTALAWMLSAVITAVAGVFYAQYNLFVEPTSAFGLSTITLIVVPAILGGMGTLWGPVVGSIIIPLGLLLSRLSNGHGVASLNLLIYGAILIVVLRVYPGGLVSAWRALVGTRLARSGAARSTTAPSSAARSTTAPSSAAPSTTAPSRGSGRLARGCGAPPRSHATAGHNRHRPPAAGDRRSQELRRGEGPAGRDLLGRPRGDGRPARPQRRRQEHPVQLHRRRGEGGQRPGGAGRAGHHPPRRPPAGPARHRPDLPDHQALPEPVGPRERGGGDAAPVRVHRRRGARR
jgi:branched-chain amino acid transport system permease protein